MEPALRINLAPERRLVMTFALRQALDVLQMPQLDLAQWLLAEIEKNPLLELSPFPKKKRFEGDYPSKPTLYEHLMNQIRDHFLDEKDREKALRLLHLIDERGFLPEDVEDGRILSILQTFDPPGIFARSLRESLLNQLKIKGLFQDLAYTLIEKHYGDLLHGRFALLKKKLKTADLKAAFRVLGRLTLRPSLGFQEEVNTPITPDLLIERIEGGWTLELVEDELPRFQMQYSDVDGESEEEKESLRSLKTQAKWIFRSLNRRRKLLREIGRILLRKQARFLDQKGPLCPLTIKDLSAKLEIHESTLSRALSGKYALTPRGILPLKSLITSDPEALSAKQMLERFIASEDKRNPLTDEQLAEALKVKGFQIARRTIAKYRRQLKIGSATKRKHT